MLRLAHGLEGVDDDQRRKRLRRAAVEARPHRKRRAREDARARVAPDRHEVKRGDLAPVHLERPDLDARVMRAVVDLEEREAARAPALRRAERDDVLVPVRRRLDPLRPPLAEAAVRLVVAVDQHQRRARPDAPQVDRQRERLVRLPLEVRVEVADDVVVLAERAQRPVAAQGGRLLADDARRQAPRPLHRLGEVGVPDQVSAALARRRMSRRHETGRQHDCKLANSPHQAFLFRSFHAAHYTKKQPL